MSYCHSTSIPRLLGAVALAGTIASAAPVLGANPSTPQVGKNVVQDLGASERVAFSDKLRMYSQRMSAAACTVSSNAAPFMSRGFLSVAQREFNRIVNALENGDRALGIVGGEQNARTLGYLQRLRDQWAPMDEIVDRILADGASPDLVADLAARNSELMEVSAIVVAVISGQYSNPAALLQSDAIRLGIAGRQRMLGQKLSSDLCLQQMELGTEATRASLEETRDRFSLSLTALREGMPSAGVYPSNDPAIQDGLSVVAAKWEILQGPLDAVLAGQRLDTETQARVFNALNGLTHEMDKVVILYTKASKQKL